MDADFWRKRWEACEIGFHEDEANELLVAHWGALGTEPGDRVFVPLCGKTRDIAWLLSRGHRVAGAELSEIAVRQLFDELGCAPETVVDGSLVKFSAENVEIFVGDIFELTAERLGPVEAVYDRAATVALPHDMRTRYATHLRSLTQRAPQFVICFEYDQSALEGPPFSVNEAEMERLHAGDYALSKIAERPVAGGLKGRCPASEAAWLLT
ncbi:thiopurine S-methyltransferase [Rubrimonas cliftonensis]|uniref:Thiopurine S-methyltransferase n=1 Tax=Rubrimonas cliftonensis TaxID=89524 RepID=A0A1H3VKX4_9RHOB|nr:thiopurine S-methyltransferase [Rubrimonas cliftonensis]SDZ75420.1 thiopurine S-methyltransferase [Rubrimonas cliftonensis]